MYNRVLIPAPLILNAKNFGEASSLLKNNTCLDDSHIDINMTREIIMQVMRIMISQSAHEINLIWTNKDVEKQIMNELPTRLKRRTKSIFLTDIPSNFLSFFEPICNEKIYSPTLDILINDFYLLHLACKERTEVDIRCTLNTLKNFDNVFNKSEYLKTSPGVPDLIAELTGLINAYKYSENMESFVDTNQEIPLDRRIDDFLNDAFVERLSREKYYFGIPSRVKESIFNFKQLIKNNILSNIECVIKPFFFANSPIELNIINGQDKTYSPPIGPLKSIYMSEINDHIRKESLLKLHYVDTSPINRAGYMIHECNGHEINRSLDAAGWDFEGGEYCLGHADWINIDLSNSKLGKLVF
jgi:hypothetical protein